MFRPAYILLLRAVAILLGCLTAAMSPAADRQYPITPPQLIGELERVDPDWLIDMHGNSHRYLQELMRLRFDATSAVIAKIDRLEQSGDAPELRRALYRVLGTVKDPAAIGWLRRKLDAGQHEVLVHDWLAWWNELHPDYGASPWLTGRGDWIDFLGAGLRSDPEPDRAAAWLEVLGGFAGPEVVGLFEAARETAAPNARLLIEAVLAEHGRVPDAAAIEAALTALQDGTQYDEWVARMAIRLRHPAFVPWLISRLDSSNPFLNTKYALKRIAYRSDVEGTADWKAWHAAHRHESQRDWRDRQLATLSGMLASDEAAAAAWFGMAVYVLDDIELAAYVETELLPRRAFANSIAVWIDRTHRPAYRARLAPIARKLADTGGLDDEAKRLLVERGYVAPDLPPTWADEVFRMNGRV